MGYEDCQLQKFVSPFQAMYGALQRWTLYFEKGAQYPLSFFAAIAFAMGITRFEEAANFLFFLFFSIEQNHKAHIVCPSLPNLPNLPNSLRSSAPSASNTSQGVLLS